MTDIWAACDLLDKDAVQAILAQGKENANAYDSFRMTPLHHVAKSANLNHHLAVEVAQMLLDAGAFPSEKNNNGIAPIHLAAKTGKIELVKLIVKKDDESPQLRTRDGKTAFNFAETAGHREIASFLNSLE